MCPVTVGHVAGSVVVSLGTGGGYRDIQGKVDARTVDVNTESDHKELPHPVALD